MAMNTERDRKTFSPVVRRRRFRAAPAWPPTRIVHGARSIPNRAHAHIADPRRLASPIQNAQGVALFQALAHCRTAQEALL